MMAPLYSTNITYCQMRRHSSWHRAAYLEQSDIIVVWVDKGGHTTIGVERYERFLLDLDEIVIDFFVRQIELLEDYGYLGRVRGAVMAMKDEGLEAGHCMGVKVMRFLAR